MELVKGWWEIAKETWKRYREDSGSLMAAAISFFVLLSLIPLLALAVSVLGFVLTGDQARQETLKAIGSLFPAQADQLGRMLHDLVDGRSQVGGLALLGLLWTSSQLFLNLQLALNAVWDVTSGRGFIKARLVALGVMLLSGLMLVVSAAASWTLRFIRGLDLGIGIRPDSIPYIWDVGATLIGIAASVGLFLVIYRMAPDAYVRWKPALVGALFAGLAFELAKQLFGWYIANFGNYNAVYGSLGSLIMLVTWVYYSATILVLGAELTDTYADRTGKAAAEPKPQPGKVPHPGTGPASSRLPRPGRA